MLVFEDKANCLDCQYLHRPNPVEDKFLCLRSLEQITHELDEAILCAGFEDLKIYWAPLFIEETKSYL